MLLRLAYLRCGMLSPHKIVVAVCLLSWQFASAEPDGINPPAAKPFVPPGNEFIATAPADASIDLGTAEGVKAVAGEWRYSDTKIIETEFKNPDKTPNKTYDYEPHAGAADFDDSKWVVLEPAALKKPRSTGKLCFNWYRIKLTIPEQIGAFKTAGCRVTFETTIDDYAEIWVDGKMPHSLGKAAARSSRGLTRPIA